MGKHYRHWKEPTLSKEDREGSLRDSNVQNCAIAKGMSRGKLTVKDGVPVRTVPKGTLQKLKETRRPLGVLDGGMSRRKVGYVIDPSNGKRYVAYAWTPVASKTAAFEEYRMYTPEGAQKFTDVDGIKKMMPGTLPEYFTSEDDWSDEASADNRQLLMDPKPGGIGYTLVGRRLPEPVEQQRDKRVAQGDEK